LLCTFNHNSSSDQPSKKGHFQTKENASEHPSKKDNSSEQPYNNGQGILTVILKRKDNSKRKENASEHLVSKDFFWIGLQ
jgi:hypothetical protein